MPAAALQRKRRADRKPGAGAQSSATILAEIAEAVLEGPDVDWPAAAERTEAHVFRIIELGAQRQGDRFHGESLPVGPDALCRPTRFPRFLAEIASQSLQQVLDQNVGRGGHRDVNRRKRLVFHVGAGVQVVIERGGDDFSRQLSRRSSLPQRTAEIDPIERENDIGLAEKFACRRRKYVERRQMVRRMIGRKDRALLEVGHNTGTEPLGEADAPLPKFRLARAASEHDHRPLGIRKQRRGLRDRASGRSRWLGRREAGNLRPFRLVVEALLLEAGIQTNVDRRGRRGARGDVGAAHRFHQRSRGGGLIVPFDQRADIGALIARGVNPVDPGAALFCIERTGRAKHDHRDPVTPRVEQAHHPMQQADIAVQHAGHRLAGSLGVSVGNRH